MFAVRSGTAGGSARLALASATEDRGRLVLSCFHLLPELVQLPAIEDLPGLLEHLAFLLLDVVADVLDHDLGLRAPRLVLDRHPVELAHQPVDDAMLP